MEIKTLCDSEPIIETEQEINVDLLTRIADHIEGHPREFEMNEWDGKARRGNWFTNFLRIAPCDTTHCIAGLACVLEGASMERSIPATAQKILGLTYEQADRLFYVTSWPEPFHCDYSEPKYFASNAWVASQRIRHFIATNGEE